MDNKIIFIIIFIATFVATCSTMRHSIDVDTNTKKVIVKGDVIIYMDSLGFDSL